MLAFVVFKVIIIIRFRIVINFNLQPLWEFQFYDWTKISDSVSRS